MDAQHRSHATHSDSDHTPVPAGLSWPTRLLTSPTLWGLLATWAFYQSLPYLPDGQRSLLARYFQGHPLEYVLAGLFFVGVATLAIKVIRLRSERRAFAQLRGVMASQSERELEPFARHEAGRAALGLLTLSRRDRRAERLEAHADHTAEGMLDELAGSYELFQTILWAIPILGFLGTVMGITLAIAHVTPDQLEGSLSSVTGGLAVAFDTTALALALSIPLGFAYRFARRSEERLLGEIHSWLRTDLVGQLHEGQGDRLLSAEFDAAALILERTERLIGEHCGAWQTAIAHAKESWTESFAVSQQSLLDQLQQQTESQLHSRGAALAQGTDAIVRGFDEGVQSLASLHANAAELQSETLGRWREEMHASMQAFREEMSRAAAESRDDWSRSRELMADSLNTWRRHVEELTRELTEQRQTAVRQVELLEQVARSEADLVTLQASLDETLKTREVVESLEEILHQLTGAVHMLTARARKAA